MSDSALSPPRTPPGPRVRRIAGVARGLVLAGGALFVINAVCTWLFPDYAATTLKTQTHVEILGALTTRTRLLYALWDLPSLAVILMALYHLWRLFGEYLQSRVFGPLALTSLRGFARWLLVGAFWSPVYRAVLSVIATWQNGPGKRQLNLDLSSDDFMLLLLGVVILAICSVMVEAARIAEDNEGFV